MAPAIKFPLKGEYIELAQLLKASRVLSSTGGMSKVIVRNGTVQLNGVVEIQPGKKIRKGDVILFEGGCPLAAGEGKGVPSA